MDFEDNRGWLKIYRKIENWCWFNDPNTFVIFIHLLLMANLEDKNWRGIFIERGSMITSVSKLAKRTGVSVRSVRTSLEHLKSTNEVTMSTTSKYTYISINNFNKYQEVTNKTPNSRQGTDKVPTTTKEVKNIRNKEDINININTPKAGDSFVNRILETFKKKVGHNPTDPKPRYEAYNLVRRIKKLIKEVGKPDTEEQTNRVIDKYFEWLDKQDWFVNVQNMSVIRRKFEIYQQNVINHLKPNVQEN